MDAFIILGQIPGTEYYLTFTDIVATCVAVVFICLAVVELRYLKVMSIVAEDVRYKSKLS